MEYVNQLISMSGFPVVTAFLIGLLASISPCPLATNIAAVAYISKESSDNKGSIVKGLVYTLGRGVSYTLLALLIYFGISQFAIASIFQGWGDKVIGPILVIFGLVMIDIIKINLGKNKKLEKLNVYLADKGLLGSFLLGMLFALAICPYSGILFFGMLMPLVVKTSGGLILPIFFAFGTGVPVIAFSFIIVFAKEKLGKAFNATRKVEKYLRYGVAGIFIITGLYYTKYLISYLFRL